MGMNDVWIVVRVLVNWLVVGNFPEEQSVRLLLLLSIRLSLVMNNLWLNRGRISDVLTRGRLTVGRRGRIRCGVGSSGRSTITHVGRLNLGECGVLEEGGGGTQWILENFKQRGERI